MLKSTVQLRLGQNLTMTPQLQQAIRLLQLSTLELQTQIQETLENNPMLEMLEDEETDVDDAPHMDREDAPSFEDAQEDVDRLSTEMEGMSGQDIPEELPVDSNWDDIYDISATAGPGPDAEGLDIFENQMGPVAGLHEHLLSQLNLLTLSDRDRAIALTIIDAINDDGYLGESLEQIHTDLAIHQELELELDEVEAVLHMVQHLDPAGIGARNLSECLKLQLEQFPADTPWLDMARQLVDRHLGDIAARDFRFVQRELGLRDEELHQVIGLIQSLNPRPGSLLSSTAPEYVIPDVFVRRLEGRWQVELNPDVSPRLRVNPFYARMVRRSDASEDNTYLRNNLQEARWFIKSLQSRNETLLRVATAIVEHQRPFLEHGDEAMKPLVLRDIAEQLEMHESTISRVTTQKYMHTPRGIHEFKYFFSSHVGTSDGGECSATAIRAMIRTLVSEEPRGKPMSDSKIARILMDRGIQVARRTVAKYREAMSIPPSSERKRLA